MSKWIVNTYTFSPIQGGYFVTQGNLNYTLISGNLTLNAGDTSKVTFVVPKSVADDLYPVRTLVEVKFGNGLNPERKFFGTVVKKTRMVPEGTYRFDAVGVLGSYQFLPNYNNYGADATVSGIISVESQRFRGYYQSGSPYYTPSPWEMLYSGHDEIPSSFGSLVGPYANLKLTCNLESLQKRSKNAYEFLKAITNEQSFVLPEDYVNPPYIFRWFENGETARFGQIAGENEQAITYDTNLISCSLAEEPYYTRVVTYGNSGGTYYYNEQSGNGYPCPFNYARIPLPNKADGSAYTYVEVQNATRGELKKYPQLIEATAFDRHIVDESVPWLDMSKRVYVFYAPDEYVKAEITQIVYDFADPTKDRVKLGKIVQTATDSIASVSEQIENTASEGGNVAQWLKSMVDRPTSLDFAHINDSQRAHARLDQSTSSLSDGVNSIFGEGYVLTFMWDTTEKWDSQFYLPDADGKPPAYRTYRPNSGWSGVWRFDTAQESTVTVDGITWTVIRHRDGYVDMYADITLNGTWQAWGDMYVLEPTSTYSLPITVTKKLADITTYLYTAGNANSALPTTYTPTSDNNKTTCALLRPTTGSDNTDYYCRKYIRAKI